MALSESEWTARKAASAARRKAASTVWKATHRDETNARERIARAARKAAAVPDKPCEWCGNLFAMTGRNLGRDAGRFCSRACGHEYQRVIRAIGKAQRLARQATARATAALVRAECAALQRIAKYKEKPRTFRQACRQCAAPMATRRTVARHAVTCTDCKADNEWITERTHKAKRRARERGVEAESINPLVVFAVYNWQCNRCHCSTPRSLRCTTQANAPELDHVIALANGGAHTWSNVQLLCRACNQAKGAS